MRPLVCRILVRGFLFFLIMPGFARAQIPVTDVGNLLQNTIQVVQSVALVANMALELTPLDDEFSADLDSLGTIVEEAQGLSYDLRSLNAQVTARWAAANQWRVPWPRCLASPSIPFRGHVYREVSKPGAVSQ
jgi:conjugal transfer/entry exclusion protein